MLQYIIAGLVLGSVYAIAASGVVVTYVSTGTMNFAFGAMAYSLGRTYYYLQVQRGWGLLASAVFTLAAVGPLLGVLLYLLLFRFLRTSSPLTRIVATIGLSVALPAVVDLAFKKIHLGSVPGIAPRPVHIYRVAGVAITLDQVIVLGAVIALAGGGAAILRWTRAGLQVRALVDSPAMTSLSGSRPSTLSLGVWAVSTFLAGLTGVLAAPIIGLNIEAFTTLLASAFAAVVAARLVNLVTAGAVALTMGVAGALLQRYVPRDTFFGSAVLPSVPFAFILVFLVYQGVRRNTTDEGTGLGGPVDAAVLPKGVTQVISSATAGDRGWRRVISLVALATVIALPLVLSNYWVGLAAQGVVFGVVMLSMTLLTGHGGMIWLCVVTFAGMGAVTTGQLATVYDQPLWIAVLGGAVIAGAAGALVAVLTVRLGDLSVALVTLTVGLLVDGLVFTRARFTALGAGVRVTRPEFFDSDTKMLVFATGAFSLLALLIVAFRRSTTGLATEAVRWSPIGARSIGLSVVQAKVLVATLAAVVAGLGGGLLVVQSGYARPAAFPTLLGMVWLAVLVTLGSRSTIAALVAGLSLMLFPAILSDHLSSRWAPLPTAMFGLGAVMVARDPAGVLASYGRAVDAVASLFRRRPPPGQLTRNDADIAATVSS